MVYIFFQIKYTEAILSYSTRKLLWFEITKRLIAVSKNKVIVLFTIIFGIRSFPVVSLLWTSVHPEGYRLQSLPLFVLPCC